MSGAGVGKGKIAKTLKRKSSAKKESITKNENNQDTPDTSSEVKSKYFKENSPSQNDDGNDTQTAVSVNEIHPPGKRLTQEFFEKSCVDLSKALLGKIMVRKLDSGEHLGGAIVETEAYLGGEDKAAHSYQGKKTSRNEAMYMKPGTSYVYNIYGMYQCINISSQGDGAAVLIRAIDPLRGLDTMKSLRGAKRSKGGKGLKIKDLGSGPSKLTQALDIKKDNGNKQDLTTCDYIWLEDAEDISEENLVISTRIGVDYAGEWAKKPLRFYVKDNQSVSVRDKTAEQLQPEEKNIEVIEKFTKNLCPTQTNCNTSSSVDLADELHNDHLPHIYSQPTNSNPQDVTQSLNLNSDANRYTMSDFDLDGLTLAKSLLGAILVRTLPSGVELQGRIVEAEAYLGTQDGACHCYGGKRTARTSTMFMPPGTAYVYNIYYNYCCFNISCQGEGCVVLVRSLEPLEGIAEMRTFRGQKRSDQGEGLKDHELCNGPAKLCMALNIDKAKFDKTDLVSSEHVWIKKSSGKIDSPVTNTADSIIVSTRIGLKSASSEWAAKPWRFYLKGNKSVSVRDKEAEAKLDSIT